MAQGPPLGTEGTNNKLSVFSTFSPQCPTPAVQGCPSIHPGLSYAGQKGGQQF